MKISEMKRPKLTEAEYSDHRESYDGYCVACGEWGEGGVEPDARAYECEACNQMTVYGAEELVLMDLVDFQEEPA